MTNKIIIQNLEKSFFQNKKKFLVLKIDNLIIKKHEFISIVGSSGCGKTTLLNILGGFLPFEKGSVDIFGKTNIKPSSDRAFVFQEDAVFPWLSVQDNIGYGLKIKGTSKEIRKKDVDYYIELVGLSGTELLYPKELSGGMKKRVDLARAYANNPSILLMDEPFGSLDFFTRRDMQIKLLELLQLEKKTVIFITHDISEAILLSDRIFVMSNQPGTIQKTFTIPFNSNRNHDIEHCDDFLTIKNDIEKLINDGTQNEE